jgi:hypothetical protein
MSSFSRISSVFSVCPWCIFPRPFFVQSQFPLPNPHKRHKWRAANGPLKKVDNVLILKCSGYVGSALPTEPL